MSKVKEHFISRWKENGLLIEFDWKQLEVVVFAFLTQDPQLLNDIREGRDIHRELGAHIFKCLPDEVTDEQRQQIKPGTFLCIYGGGPNKFAREHKVSLDFAKEFIETFYSRYPIAKQWQDNLISKVEATKYKINEFSINNVQKEEGYLESITGRRYFFKTDLVPDFMQNTLGTRMGFNPPEIKNYPVQGLATADIHLMALGLLWRRSIAYRDRYLLINTVHDSVLIDCKKEWFDWSCKYIKSVLESVVELLKKQFNIDFNVPLLIDFKSGSNWGFVND